MKVFIVGSETIDKLDIANEIIAQNDDFNICKTFTSKHEYVGSYMFELDNEDIVLAWKNNVLLFLDYSDKKILGITLDDFKYSDIIPISTKHFNMIIDDVLVNNEILILWIDNKSKHSKDELIEVRYLQERIESFSLPMIYFIDEPKEEIARITIDYILGDEVQRKEILEENS